MPPLPLVDIICDYKPFLCRTVSSREVQLVPADKRILVAALHQEGGKIPLSVADDRLCFGRQRLHSILLLLILLGGLMGKPGYIVQL